MGSRRKTGKSGNIFRVRLTRGLNSESIVKITDNSGAKMAKIISVIGLVTRLNRYPYATVGDMVVCSIKKGTPELRKKVMRCIIVRQRQIIHRIDGSRVKFEDNAAVLVTDEGDPKGSIIHGPVAREAAELYPRISNISSQIV
jgi:large subunit ribosomal protein L14